MIWKAIIIDDFPWWHWCVFSSPLFRKWYSDDDDEVSDTSNIIIIRYSSVLIVMIIMYCEEMISSIIIVCIDIMMICYYWPLQNDDMWHDDKWQHCVLCVCGNVLMIIPCLYYQNKRINAVSLDINMINMKVTCWYYSWHWWRYWWHYWWWYYYWPSGWWWWSHWWPNWWYDDDNVDDVCNDDMMKWYSYWRSQFDDHSVAPDDDTDDDIVLQYR